MTDRKFTPPTEFPTKYRTHQGGEDVEVTIWAKTSHMQCPYIGTYRDSDDFTCTDMWHPAGLWDIPPEPETRTVWVNFYPVGPHHNTKEDADRLAGTSREACVEVTYTVGQNL